MRNERESWLAALLPPPNTASALEQLRASGGAGADRAAVCVVDGQRRRVADRTDGRFGGAAVLPASPLAQPWPVIGANLVSALVGISCVQLFGTGLLTAPLAGGLAIAAMFALRCLHPPGGAVALTAVLAGPAVHALGFEFALLPVALNSTLMVGAALLVNNATGRRYPHPHRSVLANTHHTGDTAPTARLGFQREDLDEVLKHYGQVLDVGRDDLENIILATETDAYERRFGIITCGAIISRDVATAEFSTELEEAWRMMRHHHVHAMPVLNRARRVIGMVAQSDFLRDSDLDDFRTLGARLRLLIRRTRHTHSDKPEVVGQIMTRAVQGAYLDTPIVELVLLMANSGLHHLPVLDRENRFVGMVTRSDVIAALYQSRLSEPPLSLAS